MENKVTLLLLLIAGNCFAQHELVGLYGECKNGYMCQQVLFKSDSTFEFYDLLHLRGWVVSSGFWQLRNDTLIMNSSSAPYKVEYQGNAMASIVTVKIQVDNIPAEYATIKCDKESYELNMDGIANIPCCNFDSIYVEYLGVYVGSISFDKSKLKTTSTIIISIDSKYIHKYKFNNEQWLFKGKKLFFAKNPNGAFDEELYFLKTRLSSLRYR